MLTLPNNQDFMLKSEYITPDHTVFKKIKQLIH